MFAALLGCCSALCSGLSGNLPDGFLKATYFEKIWIFVFENHEKCVFFSFVENFFVCSPSGKIACRNSKK